MFLRSKPTKSTAKIAIATLALIVVAIMGITSWIRSQAVVARPVYAFDVNDKRQLVGHASNVFVGQVVRQTGTVGQPTSKPGYTAPQTQFAVTVQENIKGNLTDTITVNQAGGTRDGVAVLMNGDPLLIPGMTYLFVVRYNAENKWYTVTTPALANIPVADVAQRGQLVQEFRQAYQQQIVRP